MGYWNQLAIVLGLVGGGLIVGSVIVLAVVFAIPGTNIETLFRDANNVGLVRILSLLNALVGFALPALAFAMIVNRKKPFVQLGATHSFNIRQVFFVVVIAFSAVYVGAMLAQVNELIPISKSLEKRFKAAQETYMNNVMAIANMRGFADYLITLVLIALLPAIAEELLFRSCLQPVMIGLTRHVFAGILISSILFSLMHFEYYGFLTRMFLGMLLGYIYYYSKSFWLNALAHFINNAIGVTQMYILSRQGKLNTAAMDDRFPWAVGIGATVLLLFLVARFKQESEKYNAEHPAPEPAIEDEIGKTTAGD